MLNDRPQIVGILNVTPDSFSDGGEHNQVDAAIAHGLRLVEEGADMIDVGGESTRPGAGAVSSRDEIDRVVPVIRALAAQADTPISIDTSKPEVMQAAVAAGAGMINDVYALRLDGALDTAAALGVPVCLMHMQGEPRHMQDNPYYDDVVGDVHRFLAERVLAARKAGMKPHLITVDPGFGFGKNKVHNLTLLHSLDVFSDLSAGIYVGISRKRTIGMITGREKPHERVFGSVAAALLAAQKGAAFIRVHDVAATRDVLSVWQAMEAVAHKAA